MIVVHHLGFLIHHIKNDRSSRIFIREEEPEEDEDGEKEHESAMHVEGSDSASSVSIQSSDRIIIPASEVDAIDHEMTRGFPPHFPFRLPPPTLEEDINLIASFTIPCS